jgi:hypothetical protein
MRGYKVITQILHYFRRNPEATDTLEGIARWRLLEEEIRRSLQETQQAVEWLVAKGFLLEESRVGSGKLYRLNPERTAEISLFLLQGEAVLSPERQD